MAKAKTLPPRLDAIHLNGLEDGDPGSLGAHERSDGERFIDADLTALDLTGSLFSGCEFLSCTAHATDFRTASFIETRFHRLNAPVLQAPRARFRDVIVENSRIGSGELYEARLESVHFINCKIGYVNLRAAKLTDVLFTNCDIDELDLAAAEASRVAFSHSKTRSLTLGRASLTHVDLRGLEIGELAGLDGLRGATLSPLQSIELAPAMAAELGLKIEP